MINPAKECMDWMLQNISTLALFNNKVFEVYDPGVLKDIAAKLTFPICGLMYEGLRPWGDDTDSGASVSLGVGVLVLADSRIRDARQTADKDAVTSLLDTLRDSIIGKISPTNHAWVFKLEMPMDLGNRGLVYYQKWATRLVMP